MNVILIGLIIVLIYITIKEYKEIKKFYKALEEFEGKTFKDIFQRKWVFKISETHEGFTLINEEEKLKESVYINRGNESDIRRMVEFTLMMVADRKMIEELKGKGKWE